MPKKTKTSQKMKALIAAADDLSKEIPLEPPIDAANLTEEELVKELTEVITDDLLGEDDDIALATRNTLIEIGAIEGEKKTKAAKTKTPTKKTKKQPPKADSKAIGKSKGKATAKPKTEKKTASKKNEKATAKPKVKKAYKPRKIREPGIMAAIYEIIEKKGPISREGILTALAKKYPDRRKDGMISSVSHETHDAALRYRKPLQVDEKGRFSIK